MIREAIEYIRELNKEIDFEWFHDEVYTSAPVHKVLAPLREPIYIKSLSGLVDIIKDDFDNDERLLIVVEDYDRVVVQTELNENRRRETLMIATADTPDIVLNHYRKLDEFNTQLQALFVKNEDKQKLLSILGNLKSHNVKNYGDDGITQVVETKKGITLAQNEVIPNPVALKPFRTFTEISQPESEFVFRLTENDIGISGAFFEADGGAWRNQARISIKQYLMDQLSGVHEEGRILII